MTEQAERVQRTPKPIAYMIVGSQHSWLQWTPDVAEADKPLVRIVPLYPLAEDAARSQLDAESL